MKHKLKVHILEQTREVEIDTDEPQRYVDGFLDANIYPDRTDDFDGFPQGGHDGLDNLHCEITLIEPPKPKLFDTDAVKRKIEEERTEADDKDAAMMEYVAMRDEMMTADAVVLDAELGSLGFRTERSGNDLSIRNDNEIVTRVEYRILMSRTTNRFGATVDRPSVIRRSTPVIGQADSLEEILAATRFVDCITSAYRNSL